MPSPICPKSTLIKKAVPNRYRMHKGDGDMWPVTWAADGHLYTAAGDNQKSPMNTWRIEDHPGMGEWGSPIKVLLIDNMPLDPKVYCTRPNVHPLWGIKPASMLAMDGVIYFAVQLMNFGDNPAFNRQHNINSWIMTSTDNAVTWNKTATDENFFTGRVASPHFCQFGKDYEGARDEYVYAYFPAAEDGNSYWENGDFILLGRVHKKEILNRGAWEFFTGERNGAQLWHADDEKAKPVFSYPLMTGENHVSYNAGLKRYIMGNYGFVNDKGEPMPYHQNNSFNADIQRSQLTLFEAPEPWGPWSHFYTDEDWGVRGGYQPCFPTKWMSADGTSVWMVYSGSEEDYNFTVQHFKLEI
ncbi:MAG: DUF4185 domain-containing protein [Defluviitaleaceae bacterium]|nr:DUF4185 domain-containing protein [Defluviitaleaceae bacterium]